MSKALIAFEQAPLQARQNYAKALSLSSLLPDDYKGQPANVLVAIEYGASLGLAPMTAINGINVIKGKPTLSADLMASLVRRAGCKLRIEVSGEGQQTEVTASLVRPDDPEFTFSVLWNWARAQRAGLTNSRNWQAYPEQMMRSRAISEVCRQGASDYLSGMVYVAEELTTPVQPSPLDGSSTDSPQLVQGVASVEIIDGQTRVQGYSSAPMRDSARSGAEPATSKSVQTKESAEDRSDAGSAPSQTADESLDASASSGGADDGTPSSDSSAQLAELQAAVVDTADSLDYSPERLKKGCLWASDGATFMPDELTRDQCEKLINQMIQTAEVEAAK